MLVEMRSLAGLSLLATGCNLAFPLDGDGPPIPTFPGLLARYSLDNLAGGFTLSDDSKQGRDAVCIASACPTEIEGIHGGALHFDGTQLARAEPTDALSAPNGFTVSLWINLDEIPQPDGDTPNFACAVSKPYLSSATNGALASWQACYASSAPGLEDVVFFGSATNDDPDNVRGIPLEIARWYHIALIWDGAGDKTLYVDGVVAGAKSMGPAVVFDSTELVFGVDIDVADRLEYPWRGAIDEVQLYDRELALAELAELAAPPR